MECCIYLGLPFGNPFVADVEPTKKYMHQYLEKLWLSLEGNYGIEPGCIGPLKESDAYPKLTYTYVVKHTKPSYATRKSHWNHKMILWVSEYVPDASKACGYHTGRTIVLK